MAPLLPQIVGADVDTPTRKGRAVTVDLDEPRPPQGRPRLRPPLVALLVLVAVVASSVGTLVLERRRQQAADDAVVSLTALVSGYHRALVAGGALRIEGTLAVVNTGPSPVTVDSVSGAVGSLTFTSSGATVVRPGVKDIEVDVVVACPGAVSADPVTVRFTVHTVDGVARETTAVMAVSGTTWSMPHEQACSPRPDRSAAVTLPDR